MTFTEDKNMIPQPRYTSDNPRFYTKWLVRTPEVEKWEGIIGRELRRGQEICSFDGRLLQLRCCSIGTPCYSHERLPPRHHWMDYTSNPDQAMAAIEEILNQHGTHERIQEFPLHFGLNTLKSENLPYILYFIARHGTADDLRRLVKLGVPLDYDNGKASGVAMHIAAFDWDLGSLQRLLDAGADVNAKAQSTGWTPLTAATNRVYKLHEGHCDRINPDLAAPVIRLILDRGVDITMADGEELTPAEYAKKGKRPDLAEIIRLSPQTPATGISPQGALGGARAAILKFG